MKPGQVFLTDHELKVLENLCNCVARNFPAQANSTLSSKSRLSPHQESGTSPQEDDDEFCDPEDAESCDDLDDLFRPSTDSMAAPCSANSNWDYVRTLPILSLLCHPCVIHCSSTHAHGLDVHADAIVRRQCIM